MLQPSSDDSQRDVTVHRAVTIAFAGLVLFSALGSVVSTQRTGVTGNNTTANVTTTDAPSDTLRGGQDAIQGGQLANPYTGDQAANGNYADGDGIQGGRLADLQRGDQASNGSDG